MTNLIERITEAIIRQEGMSSVYANPGNLRAAPWVVTPVQYTSPDPTKRFWAPASRAQGIAGAAHVVALRIAMGQTLRQLISAWAPPSDGNDTQAYICNVAAWAGIPDVDTKLYIYLEDQGNAGQKDKLA